MMIRSTSLAIHVLITTSNNITVEELKNSQKFYDDALKNIQASHDSFLNMIEIVATIIGIFVTAIGILITKIAFDVKNSKDSEIEKQKEKLFQIVNTEIGKSKDDFKREIQGKMDASFRFTSRIYRRSAESYLIEKDNFHEFFYYMHIFYRCLIEIKKLNTYDLDRLERTFDKISGKISKKKTIEIPDENRDNISWYNVHLLKFIDRCCNDQTLYKYFSISKSIYNEIFNINVYIKGDKSNELNLIEEIDRCMNKDKHPKDEIKKILEFAIKYKDGDKKTNPSI